MTNPDPNAQSGDPNAQSGGTGDGTGTGGDPGAGGAGAQSGAPDAGQQNPPPATVTQAEYDALRARLQAADQNRAKAEADLKQIRDKDLPALEKATRDLAEAEKVRDAALADLKQTRLENAFVTDNKYKWKNPKTALKLADLSKVEVDDDGTVRNLTAALDALAKAEPYLLEEDTSGDDDGSGGDSNGAGRGSTGAPAGGGRQADTKTDAKKFAARIPALRTRGIGT